MMITNNACFKKMWQEEQGSFTLEASLVFPLVLLITVAIIFLSLILYQKVVISSLASVSAERIAFNWNDSYQNITTGASAPGQNDGLYWRIFQDKTATVKIANNQVSTTGFLSQRKLAQAAVFLPNGVQGTLSYSHSLWSSYVLVKLQSTLKTPIFIRNWLSERWVNAEAKVHVVDPAEFIRNIDFTKQYTDIIMNQLKNSFHKSGILKKIASSSDANTNDTYSSEKEARKHLQKIQLGKNNVTISTNPVNVYRHIDVLDQNSIAHQALCGRISYSQEKREEIQKDIYLLQTGKVNGVVWHFFKRSNGTIGPTKALLRALQKNGIIVVIHN